MELIEIRDEVRSLNENAKTKNIDRFVSCVDDIHQRTDNEYIKVFSSLTSGLEKTVAAVEKWLSHSDVAERDKNIVRAINSSVVPEAMKVWQVTDRVTLRNCYMEVDVDSVKNDYSILLRRTE